MKPRDFTNFSTEALMEELKALADDLSQDPRALIIEAMDRLELISIEAVDLAHGLSKARQDANFWHEKATNAVNRNKRLDGRCQALDNQVSNLLEICRQHGVDVSSQDMINGRCKAKEAKP